MPELRDFNHRITDEDVERVVWRDFPSDQRETVLNLLRQPVTECAGWLFGRYHRQLLPQPGERPVWVRLPRLQAALVKLSEGDFERLLERFEFDAFDAVYAAEYPKFSALPRPSFAATVSEAKQWVVEGSRLREADVEQYRDWLNGPFIVRTENGV